MIGDVIARVMLECPRGHVFLHDMDHFDGYIRSMLVCCPLCAELVHCCIHGVSYVHAKSQD